MATREYAPSKEAAERVRAQLEYDKAVSDFWYDHYDEFLARYPEHHVAVKDALGDYEVVAADTDVVRLVETLDELGYDHHEIEVRKITASPPAVLIWR